MDRYLILKNGIVLTFDKEDNVGYYNIVINNNVIHQVDYYNELASDRNIYTKYPGVNIIDAKDKIIIPAFINSNINSSFALSSVFFERLNYDKLAENLSLAILEKHFTSQEFKIDLKNLLTFSYYRALSNGELFLNETSNYLSKDFLQEYHKHNFLIVQDIIFTSFSEAFSRYLSEIKKFHSIGIRDESDINNYTLSSAAKAVKDGKSKIFFEVLQKSTGQDNIRRTFSKSIFKVLGENEFLDRRVIFSNPINIQKDELDYLSDKQLNAVLCPSDILKLGEKRIESLDLTKYGINVSLGTGLLGKSVLAEMKLFSHLVKKGTLSYRQILKMAIVNPAKMFEVFETHGSIEKNKVANIILFDVSDLRNYLITPDINSEKVSEHIVENLDAKDISDIIVKGNVIRRDYKSKLFDTDTMKKTTSELIKKIVETGKYYEFKEKYLMRKRIDDLATGIKEERKLIITTGADSDERKITENPIISDSEFIVIGVRKDVNPIRSSDDDYTDSKNDYSVTEIKDISDGVEFFDDVELNENDNPLKEIKKSEPTKKVFFDDLGGNVKVTKPNEKKESEKEDSKIITPTPKESTNKSVTFKKGKIRFGFSDEDKK